MDIKYFIPVLVGLLSIDLDAQDKTPEMLSFKAPALSFYAGYGTHGPNLRMDIEMSDRYFNQSSTRLYIEVGGQGISFDQPNLIFDKVTYPSDCRLLSFAGGIAQEFVHRRLSIMPFVGLRNEYVRFKSTSLTEAIGDNGLIRWADANQTRQVGPVVNNAYGDATAFDLGCRFGCIFTSRISLAITFGYSSIRFDSADTLFGEYWGEAPYKNEYWVKRKPVRSELALRLTF